MNLTKYNLFLLKENIFFKLHVKHKINSKIYYIALYISFSYPMQFRCQIYIIFLYAQCSYLMWSAILGSFQKKTDLLLTRKAKLNCCEFLASYGAFFQSDIPSYFKTPVCDAVLSYFFMLFSFFLHSMFH